MGFSTADLVRLRPFAFHTSCEPNFHAIRAAGALRSPERILRGTEHVALLERRRPQSVTLEASGQSVVIRDTRPLRPGSLQLSGDWRLEDWLRELSSRVYFWPGTERGPIRRGRAHFERYANEGEVFVIRVPLRSLLEANRERQLQVTRCNSGAARHHGGRPVARGPETFQSPEAAGFRAAEVIELTYRDEALLPADAVWATSLDGPWETLNSAG